MVKTILIDLDETLLDFSRAEACALERALRESGAPYSEEIRQRYHAINGEQWELLEDGVLTREQALVRRFERLFAELGLEGLDAGINDRYESYLEDGRWLLPGALELLKILAPKYRLYAASNGGGTVQNRRLEGAGIREYFQGVFISEEVGFDKPSAEFFNACFARIPDFRKEEAVMIGDSLTSDIRGGRNAGLRTCWFNPRRLEPRPDIQPDFQVFALEDIPALLETF